MPISLAFDSSETDQLRADRGKCSRMLFVAEGRPSTWLVGGVEMVSVPFGDGKEDLWRLIFPGRRHLLRCHGLRFASSWGIG